MPPYRIAFVKFGGLNAGGTERWLQMMAAHLDPARFQIDYYSADGAPSLGSTARPIVADPGRIQYLKDAGIRVIPFHVGARDLRTASAVWRDTNFWDVFKESDYDLIQTAKSGPAEYPFTLMEKPVIEYRTLAGLPDTSGTIASSIHLSQWQRTEWVKRGGDPKKSAVIPIPAEPPATSDHLRRTLNIPDDALVCGFHQRVDDGIFSPIPLAAFAGLQAPNRHFILMGGSPLYRQQAQTLHLTNIHFLDHAGDAASISRFLNTLDIFTHGRKDGETFGTVFAEAMMHGKPCLSHRTPWANGQRETMGPAGLFAKDAQDYADKLNSLMTSEPLRRALASKAKLHAEKYYSVAAAVRDLSTVYQAQLEKQGTPAVGMQYGISPLGFLYYGKIETTGEIATHVMTGTVPEEFGVYLIRQFKDAVSTFIDIGANTGLYGFVMAQAQPSAQVYMVEPQPECVQQMKETVWLNNWETRVTIVPMALGNDPKEISLYASGTGASCIETFIDPSMRSSARVPMDRLDHFWETQQGPPVDFIKIDVEGLEFDVLRGAEKTITRDKPVLFVEIFDHFKGRNYQNPYYRDTLAWLEAQGYAVWRCTEQGNASPADANQPQTEGAMYLALHREKHRAWIARLSGICSAFRQEQRIHRLRKIGYLILKGFRHPQRALAGIQRYLETPGYGVRF
jgi:FkbM family methyltransferase